MTMSVTLDTMPTMPTLSREECARLVESDPRFTEEPLYVPYFWFQAVEGWADRQGDGPYGHFFEFRPSPEDLAVFPELAAYRDRTLRIVRCPTNGEVTAYLKPIEPAKAKRVAKSRKKNVAK